MGFSNLRVGHAGAFAKHPKRAATPSAACATGGFYKSPANGATIDSANPVNIVWDTSCLDTVNVDIYLYAPSAANARIHVWENVPFAAGSYNTTMKPRWWNSTASESLQLTLIAAGQPPFLSTLPAGPVFTATYTPGESGVVAADADTTVADSGITVANQPTQSHKLAPGKTAAAVLIPLLVLIALGVAYYLKIVRTRTREDHKRFSQAVDRRMSTISTDWKAMSPAGAAAAIRSSIAPGPDDPRVSGAFSFGAIRPVSTVDPSAIGTPADGLDRSAARQMAQVRPVRAGGAFADRVSRVSFADAPRPSLESRKAAGTSRAFHSAYAPPVPALPASPEEVARALSPTQTQGALALTPEDIRARIAGTRSPQDAGMDEVMPALSMMRTGSNDTTTDNELLFTPPAPPTPTHAPAAARSPVGMMPMQPVPASMMSPDEMLRAYAERSGAVSPVSPYGAPASPFAVSPVSPFGGAFSAGVSYPAPAAGGMRTLYAPTPAPASQARKSMASVYSEEDAYGGTGN